MRQDKRDSLLLVVWQMIYSVKSAVYVLGHLVILPVIWPEKQRWTFLQVDEIIEGDA